MERTHTAENGHGNGDTVNAAFFPPRDYWNQKSTSTGSSLAAVVPDETNIVAGASGVTLRTLSPHRRVAVAAWTTKHSCPDRRPLS